MATYLVDAVPDLFQNEHIFEVIGQNSFSLIYDFGTKHTLLGIDNEMGQKMHELSDSIAGFRVEKSGDMKLPPKLCVLSAYRSFDPEAEPFWDVFSCNINSGHLIISFINSTKKEAEKSKQYLEALLTSKTVKETKLANKGFAGLFANSSLHIDVYKDSEESQMARMMLESVNDALVRNNLLYKTFLLFDHSNKDIRTYVEKRMVVLSEIEMPSFDIGLLMKKLADKKSFSFGSKYCGGLCYFYGVKKLNELKSTAPPTIQGLPIGKLIKNGVAETDQNICIDRSSINLGLIVTGLPGSGKTKEAMYIVDQIAKDVPVFILSPTEEWDSFAVNHRMNLVRLFKDKTCFNFFRCPDNVDKERFYQDLSIVLSAAAGAGPYCRPMEKCLLNAFRKAYRDTNNPDPVLIYEQIIDSIIQFHGKQNSNGIKYTKHGENILASLESLRTILNDVRYSTTNTIKIEELLLGGVVFDMSLTSITTRPFLYALILNQLYALASNFDTQGDEELRMVICVEEAQIIFKEEDSPAVLDIKQKMQDFRKRGIGLILLAHNITDIELGIRRLCQIKLYLKQAPDTAYTAAKDLIFPGVEPQVVVDKLKLLDSRIGIFNHIIKKGKEKLQQESIMIRTMTYDQSDSNIFATLSNGLQDYLVNSEIEFTYGDGLQSLKANVQIQFLGDIVAEFTLGESKYITPLIKGRKYLLQLVNEKRRTIGKIEFIGKKKSQLFLDKNRLIEIVPYPPER